MESTQPNLLAQACRSAFAPGRCRRPGLALAWLLVLAAPSVAGCEAAVTTESADGRSGAADAVTLGGGGEDPTKANADGGFAAEASPAARRDRAAEGTRNVHERLTDASGEVLQPTAIGDASAPDAAMADVADVDAAAPDAGSMATEVTTDSTAGDAATSAEATDDAATGDVPDVQEAPICGKPVDPATLPPADFVDITTNLGLDPTKSHEFCVAVADLDGNGRQDFVVIERKLYQATIHAVLLGFDAPKHVYSPIDTTVFQPNFSCSLADMSGDGIPDLLMGSQAGAGVYQGTGSGGFVDQTAKWLPFLTDFAAVSLQPVDLDNDGDLDLFVGAGSEMPPCGGLKCKYTAVDLVCAFDPPPEVTAEMLDRVLIQGPQLPLVDATAKWKVPQGGNKTVVQALDIDEDGKMDMLVGDEADGHRLLHNNGVHFTSYGTSIGFHAWAAAMGWGIGDLDGNGLVDIVLADAGPSPLYLQTKAKPGAPWFFVDKTAQAGMAWPAWGASAWSPLVADFDHDGQDDLLLGMSVNMSGEKLLSFVTMCGSTMNKPMGGNPFAGQSSIDVLFTHGPGTQFVASGLPPGKFAHGMMIDQRLIDLDADGDLDVVQTRPGPSMMPSARVRILRNDLPKQGKSVQVVLKGKGKNQDAIGARVTAKIGGVVRKRWLNGSGGFGGTPNRVAHFGLGAATQALDVTVTWPDGTKSALGDMAAGQGKLATWP